MSARHTSPIGEAAIAEGADFEIVGGVEVAATFGDLRREISTVLEGAGLFDLWPRPVLSVQGEDSVSFLQGQLSQDIEGMQDGTWRFAFRLFPNGKVESFLRVVRRSSQGGFLLDTDPGYGAPLAASLERYLIRVRVELRPDESLGYLRIAGPEAARVLEEAGGEVPRESYESVVSTRLSRIGGRIEVLRAPYPGPGVGSSVGDISAYDILVGSEEAEDVWRAILELGARPCGWRSLEAFRVAAAFPALGAELDDKTIVQETGLESVAVSFEKGCYLGQELVARIDSRGHVNRYLRLLRPLSRAVDVSNGSASAVAPPGSRILWEGKDVGVVTSSVSVPVLGPICLGYVRREVEEGRKVLIKGEQQEVEATVERAPRIT